MKWWWQKKPKLPEIPPSPYQFPVSKCETPKDSGIVVEEVDTSDMTKTGIHRAWDRMTGKFKE